MKRPGLVAMAVVCQVLITPVPSGADPGCLRWKYETGTGSDFSSPAIGDDGTIYFSTSRTFGPRVPNGLYALNPDGSLKWQRLFAPGIDFYSPMVASDGTVYVQGQDDFFTTSRRYRLFAIDEQGQVKWSFDDEAFGPLPVGSSTPAEGLDGTIYHVTEAVYAHATNGTLLWDYRPQLDWDGMPSPTASIRSSPAIASDGTIYLGIHCCGRADLLALNPGGTLRWQRRIEGAAHILSSPAIDADGAVYIGAEQEFNEDESYVLAFEPNGDLRWRYLVRGARPVRSSPAIGPDGTIYVGTLRGEDTGTNGELLALRPDGTLKWSFSTPLPMEVYSSPTVGADGAIYFTAETRSVWALEPDGSVRWEFMKEDSPDSSVFLWSSPALSRDGYVYVVDKNGILYALDGKGAGLADSPWPKYHHDSRGSGSSASVVQTDPSVPDEPSCTAMDDGSCLEDNTSACLSGSRFRASITWRDFQGKTGLGNVVTSATSGERFQSEDSALFWFFGPGNWELMVKVLNACNSEFSSFWVFSSASTNVEYTLRIEDTQSGYVREYFNPLGTAAPALTDTSAFSTCP